MKVYRLFVITMTHDPCRYLLKIMETQVLNYSKISIWKGYVFARLPQVDFFNITTESPCFVGLTVLTQPLPLETIPVVRTVEKQMIIVVILRTRYAVCHISVVVSDAELAFKVYLFIFPVSGALLYTSLQKYYYNGRFIIGDPSTTHQKPNWRPTCMIGAHRRPTCRNLIGLQPGMSGLQPACRVSNQHVGSPTRHIGSPSGTSVPDGVPIRHVGLQCHTCLRSDLSVFYGSPMGLL